MLIRSILLLCCLMLCASFCSAQVSVAVQVTSTPAQIRATAAGVAAYFYENSTSPSAAYSVTPFASGTLTVPINLGVGRVFIFTRPATSPFRPGDLLGTAQATTQGPFDFVLVQYAVAPPAPQQCSNGATGGLQYDNNGVFGCTNEVTYNSANKAVLTTTPLASNANISSITGNGITATATCDLAACGLSVGQPFYLDNTSQSACNGGPYTVSAINLNTASWPSSKCTSSTGGIFGQWLAVQYYANAASYPNVVSAFTVNQDGQFEIQTLTNCNAQCSVSSLLNLDEDGHVDLWGSAGGGLSTNTSGDTCLAATSGGCGNIRIAANGGFYQYKGLQAVSGSGMPFIVYAVPATPLTGSFGPFTLFTAPSSGYGANMLYEVIGYGVATNSQPGSTMVATVHYTDTNGANSQSTSALPFSAAGNSASFDFIIQCAPNSAITFTATTNSATTYNQQVEVTLR